MFTEDRFIIKPCDFFILRHDISKEIQEDARKSASCKTAQDIFMGIRFTGSGSQAHMMACDMQLKDFTKDVRRGSYL